MGWDTAVLGELETCPQWGLQGGHMASPSPGHGKSLHSMPAPSSLVHSTHHLKNKHYIKCLHTVTCSR